MEQLVKERLERLLDQEEETRGGQRSTRPEEKVNPLKGVRS